MTPSRYPSPDEEPKAGLSSASSMITLSLLGAKFKPVFTHQLFENETIRGYEPTSEAMAAAKEIAAELEKKQFNCERESGGIFEDEDWLPHKSYEHHVHATHRLSIDVKLAASCQWCCVNLKQEDKPSYDRVSGRRRNNRQGKGERQNDTNCKQSDGGIEQDESEGEDSSYGSMASNEDEDEESENDEDSEVVDSLGRKVAFEEIMEKLKQALPLIQNPWSPKKQTRRITRSRNLEESFLSEVLGETICEYKVDSVERSGKTRDIEAHDMGNGKQTFVLTVANGCEKRVSKYHNDVQNLALWFIESADAVDLTNNQGGGFWKVLYLFQKHAVESDGANLYDEELKKSRKRRRSSFKSNELSDACWKFSLAGYVTLFFFNAPFKKPKPGLILRICQFLILPPYQRSGHGRRIMKSIYRIALNDPSIVELTVEDPAPAFVALRNHVDFDLFCEGIQTTSSIAKSFLKSKKGIDKDMGVVSLLNSAYTNENEGEKMFKFLPESEAVEASAKAKIIPSQIQKAYEMYKLKVLDKAIAKLSGEKSKESTDAKKYLQKQYRLMVKKRLHRIHKEDLGACDTMEAKKKMMAEWFEEALAHYRNLLKS